MSFSTGWFHDKEACTWVLEVLFEEYHRDLIDALLNDQLLKKVPEKDWLTENRKSFPQWKLVSFMCMGLMLKGLFRVE